MTPRLVLDAWAVLAFLQKEEPAASRVKQLLTDAEENNLQLFISIINLGEVIYRIGKVKGEVQAQETLDTIYLLPLQIVSADDENVFAAVRFKMQHPISYADAFAAALSERLEATLVTGDPELLNLKHQIQLEPLERY
ncbi:MAG: type II toxin-antitoxin system VapC family toxin [Anaerolineaceae bacterium]|nr:type II toxin-antitoxin system VapC family toxin [Anaerolineaceae bacterium]MCB9100984.1 type II toxin-antitoxin system VapC family toxin [Anaerolineales bacterium]